VDQSSFKNSVESDPTWDDRALNAKSSAVLSELDELLHIIEQLSDDDLCACFNLHTQQYHHTKHLHSKDRTCSKLVMFLMLLLPRLRDKTTALSGCNTRASTRLALTA